VKYLRRINVLAVCGLDPENDIDKIKFDCEIYHDYMKKFNEGEQIEWNIQRFTP